ncbi:hypothetical protein ACIBBB_05395 [Streptomyces sp. NPDC051217]
MPARREVRVVDAVRTPVGGYGGALASVRPERRPILHTTHGAAA